jgi:hypothetical protein
MELGNVPADGFDRTSDIGADDLELGYAKPGDQAKRKRCAAQQMPIACVRGGGARRRVLGWRS